MTDHFATLRKRHRPLTTESYTSLGRGRTSDPAAIDPDEFREDLDDTEMEEVREDLPGGRHMGRFLHEVIEALDFETLRANDDFDRWRELDEIKSNFEERMRLHQIEPRWREQAQRLVFDALRTPVRLAKKAALQGLYLSDGEPEIEFLYPIPEASHPLLSGSTDGSWKTEQGYLKGFIDYTFTHEGLTYFADWKSDRLPSYGSKVLEKHVELHYMLQARIYALGIVRLLGIRTSEAYDARFGGLLYLFLRGMTPGGNDGAGVYYRRPGWNEIKEYERGLMDLNVLREGTR